MTWSIAFAPVIPPLLLWTVVIAGAGLVALMAWRRTRGVAWRAAALAALIGALANPAFERRERSSLANIAVVVVDESASQAIDDRPKVTAAAKQALEAKLSAVPGLQVQWVTSKRAAGDKAPEAETGTRLFTDLNRALANVPTDRIAGVVMITDGRVHDVPASPGGLGFDAPVHAILTGRPDEFDRRIELIKAPRYGIVGETKENCERSSRRTMRNQLQRWGLPGAGQPFGRAADPSPRRLDREIVFRVIEEGRRSPAASTVRVRIRRGGGEPDELRSVRIGQTVTAEMAFPHAGQNIVELDLEGAPGELTLANNRVVVAAEGVRENLRVLLVSGEPHAGERTWRNLLKSDAAVDLVHFTILRPPEKQDGTPNRELSLIAFPTQELFAEKLNCFDLVIFDRYQNRGLLPPIYYDNIARFVAAHGGALLLAAGDDYAGDVSLFRTPLAAVLPATPTGQVLEIAYKANLTALGAKHPVTAGLPGTGTAEPTWGRWFRQVETVVERGDIVMAGAEKKPLLVLDRQGKGRVAMLLSDHAWLWARGFEGGGPHTDLLRRLSHWLMKEPDLEEERLIASASGMRVTVEQRSMAEAVGPIRMQGPSGDVTEVTPGKSAAGRWTATIDADVPGLYKFTTRAPSSPGAGEAVSPRVLTAIAHAGAVDQREMREVTSTEKVMGRLVEATGGGVFWARSGVFSGALGGGVDLPRISMLSNARVMAGSGWLGLKDRDAHLVKGIQSTPVFAGALALAALLALLALAWWREGR